MWQAEKTVFRGRHAVLCPEPLLYGNRALPVLVHHCIVPPFPGSIGSYGVPQGEEWGPRDDLFRVIGNGSRCVLFIPPRRRRKKCMLGKISYADGVEWNLYANLETWINNVEIHPKRENVKFVTVKNVGIKTCLRFQKRCPNNQNGKTA